MSKLSKMKFEKLISRYIDQTSSSSELKIIINSLKEPKNVKLFKSYIKTNYYSIYAMNEFETEDILNEIRKRIRMTEKKKKGYIFLKKSLKYARSFNDNIIDNTYYLVIWNLY